MKTMKRMLTVILAFLLCLSLLPAVFAADEDPTHAEGYTEEGEG